MVFESLESRRLMSGTLVVRGTPADDVIQIQEDAPGTITVTTVTSDGSQTDVFMNVKSIVVHLGKGNDDLSVNLFGTSAIVNGNDGDDAVHGSIFNGSNLDFNGNNGNDILQVDDADASTITEYDGNNGDDLASYNGSGTFIYNGGNGTDTYMDMATGPEVISRVEIIA